MKKGAVNVADDWIGGLQEPNGLNCPQGAKCIRGGSPQMPRRKWGV
jgi:hypothetical protein